MKMRALKVRFYLMDRSEAVDMRSYSIKQEIKDTLSLGIPLVFSYLVYAASGFMPWQQVSLFQLFGQAYQYSSLEY
jgi:hypothetical protein